MLWRKFNLCLKFGEVGANARNHGERGNVPALGDKSSWKERRGGTGWGLKPGALLPDSVRLLLG